jgi:PAS domain S-box-containing protein
VPSAAGSDLLQPVGDVESYRMRRTANAFYERSKRGSLFYAVSTTLVDSIARFDRISLWLFLVPVGAFVGSAWLRARHRPPSPDASAKDLRRWVRNHWHIIYLGLLLWGILVAAVGLQQATPSSAVMVAAVCTVAHATALSHAYAMYRTSARLGLVAMMGPAVLTFFLPGLGLWPVGVVLSVYFVYLLGTLAQSAKEFDHQIAMEMDLTESAVNQQTARRGLESALLFRQQLLDTIPIPVFYKDKDLIYLGCNESYAKFLGLERSRIVGKTVFDVAPPELARIYQAKDVQLMEQPGSQIYECDVESRAHQSKRHVIFHKAAFGNPGDPTSGIVGAIMDVTEIRDADNRREQVISELRQALDKVKLLSGMLPICANCKKIRDDKGYWNQIESYIGAHSEAEFSHGMCPECMHKFYPDLDEAPGK